MQYNNIIQILWKAANNVKCECMFTKTTLWFRYVTSMSSSVKINSWLSKLLLQKLKHSGIYLPHVMCAFSKRLTSPNINSGSWQNIFTTLKSETLYNVSPVEKKDVMSHFKRFPRAQWLGIPLPIIEFPLGTRSW